MKVGDYVARVTNNWQKHNKWAEFSDEKPIPTGIIVGRPKQNITGFWDVLLECGGIETFSENYLVVIDENW